MKVRVEQKHIDNGDIADAFGCAVALAVIDATGAGCVSVDESTICADDYQYTTPEIAKLFIERYDNGEKCEPFEFELVDDGP